MANWMKYTDQEMPELILISLYGCILASESEFWNRVNNNGCYKPLPKCNSTTTNKLQIQASIVTTNTNTHKEETQHHRNAVKELTDTLVLLSVLFLFPTPLHICKHEINLQ
jgi:hypothetical protein